MLRDDVVDQGHYNIEAEQHEQSLTDEDDYRPEARDEASHNTILYTVRARQ